jgi:hypothetical protein
VYPRSYQLEGCKQLGSYFTSFRLKEITRLAEQALALAARGRYCQYINREAAEVTKRRERREHCGGDREGSGAKVAKVAKRCESDANLTWRLTKQATTLSHYWEIIALLKLATLATYASLRNIRPKVSSLHASQASLYL